MKNKTILIVDDSAIVREMLKKYLQDQFTIIEADKPRECLKILAGKKPHIDLGLIDVEMPEITGFKLVKMIKKHPMYADVPLVMVTSLSGKDNLNKAVLAGACDYIVKPFDKETLLQRINKHIKDKPAPAANAENTENDVIKPDEGKIESAGGDGGADSDGDDPANQWEFVDK